MKPITVNTPSGPYAVLCGRGLLQRAGAIVSGLAANTGVFVLSSPRVWRRWGARLEESFADFGGCRRILFDDRETAKRLGTVERLCRELARAGADREALVVAFGGGVVGDVAGFVAASYLRGVRVVEVPTTLVAQVDSAIGGKTGVNLPEGKNLVGAFYQPRVVLADPAVLHTLPGREYRSGLYEVVKYGVIGDETLFRFLERNLGRVLRRNATALGWILPRCVRAKAEVVSRDERERGLRQVLNFGHTVGHALEAATRYRRFLHGEAVGWGMIAATELAVATQRLAPETAERITRLILRVGALPAVPRLAPAGLLETMRADKKARAGKLRFVLPRRIGQVEIAADVPESLVIRVLAGLRDLPRRA
jgi:3-dehydroquinate synthase